MVKTSGFFHRIGVTGVRGRLFLMVLLIVTPALAVQLYGTWSDLRQGLADRQDEVTRVAAHAQGRFETLLTKAHTVFTDLVQLNGMRNPDNCTLVFGALRSAYERLAPEATNLELSDAQGNIYCAVSPVQGERNIAGQAYFQGAVKTLGLSLGVYGRQSPASTPVLTVAYPVTSFDGTVQTVILVTYDLQWLAIWQNEVALPEGTAVTLLTREGAILQRYLNGVALPGGIVTGVAGGAATPQTPAWLAPLQQGQSVVEVPDLDGVTRLHALIPLGQLGETVAYLHLGYAVAPLYTQEYQSLGWKLTLLGLTTLAALALAAWGSEHLFFQPLHQLMERIGRVQDGDLGSRPAAVRGVKELTQLAQAFGRMTETLQQRETARLEAQAELERSEARFRAIFESSPVGIGVMGLDRKVLDMNPAMCRMYGYPREELIGQTPSLVTYPGDMARSAELFQELMTGKRNTYWDERRYVRNNGEVFWAQSTMSMVRTPAGQPLYLVGIVIDISNQRRALEELRESEARFKAMFESSAIGVIILDVNTLAFQANAAARGLVEDPTPEGKLGDIRELVHANYQIAERELFDDVVSGRRDAYDAEHCYQRPGEDCKWAHVTFSAIREAGGQLRYLVAMLEDITARKQAQATLQESEARFRAVFDSAAMGVAVMTLDRRIIQVNSTASRLTGYSVEEMQSFNPSLLAVEADRNLDQQLFAEMAAGQRDQYVVEKRYLRHDGALFWGRVNYALVRDGEGKPLYTIGVIEDITEEKRAAERLAAQEAEYRRTLEHRIAERTQELNKANELLQQKAAQDAVATERTRLARDLHDAVTQTLFSATLIADVLPELWQMNMDEGRRRLGELHELTRGALAEMRTLLVELRPNALVEVPLPTLLRQLTEAVRGRARLNVELSAEGERKLPAEVQIGLYRTAQEALNNVVKHAKATQAVVTLRLGETVRLTVADNGAGFDPSAVTADHLGLKIMRERADAIHAKFSVYSEPGEGTQVSAVWTEGSPYA